MGKWAVVVPTVRPKLFDDFMRAWEPLFTEHEVTVYPVRDEPASWETWPDWVPRQTDMCRSYGFWQAWKGGHEFILSLDDDVRPPGPLNLDPFAEYEKAFHLPWPCVPYLSVGALTDSGHEMRGFPYAELGRAMVQYGGWYGTLDYDGKTQLAGVPDYAKFTTHVIPVPRGCATTCCSMNMAWRREFTPCMWQLPVLDGRYKRFGDIWSGLIQKRILDARGEVMLINGRASVLHERASDPVKNAEIEAAGMPFNERMWAATWTARDDLRDIAWDLAASIGDPEYFAHFVKCHGQWLALFDTPNQAR